jgi:hypothetical protein
MRLRFMVSTAAPACQTALRVQDRLEPQPFRIVNSATGRTGLVIGTVTFGTGCTYHKGTLRIDSAVYAMTH